jgi:hypothetical protein
MLMRSLSIATYTKGGNTAEKNLDFGGGLSRFLLDRLGGISLPALDIFADRLFLPLLC